MKYQKGVAGWVFLGVVAAVAFAIIGSYVTNANYGNRAERGLEAVWEDNENILAQYSLKIGEIAQVPAMYRNDIKDIYKDVLKGRYGENGSQAMFQFLKEQNPQIDAGLYKAIQQAMEAGRNEFRVAQTRLVDQKRVYVTNLGYVWKGFWLETAGYPTLNVGYGAGSTDDFAIITSEYAIEAFETGVDKGIVLSQ
jgi:hypothetical protein